MKQTGIPLFCISIFLFVNTVWIQGQNLDSLLNNKRVYKALNIGYLTQSKIDDLLDDEIWSLGEWQGDFTQQQPVGGVDGTEETYVKVLYDYSNLFVAIKCMDREPELMSEIFDPHSTWYGLTIVQIGKEPTIRYRILWEIFFKPGGTMFLCLN